MGTAASEVRADVIGRIIAHAARRLTDEQLSLFRPFVGQYYEGTDASDLTDRKIADLYGAAMAHLTVATNRQPNEIKVRVYAPDLDRYGYVSQHTVVEIVSDDVPFLVDSVSMELSRHNLGLHLVVHPVIPIVRNDSGQVINVLAPPGDAASRPESFIHVEVNRETDTDVLEEIRADIERVVGDVLAAVHDWSPMRERALQVAEELSDPTGADRIRSVSGHDPLEAAELLRWLADDHFIFMGYREYELGDETGEVVLRAKAGSGLGILRQGTEQHPTGHSFAKLPPEVRKRALEPTLLNITKASSRSTIRRRSYLDYVGVKGFDSTGKVVSERRFLGLYTTSVYKEWPDEIPLLRRKVAEVVERAGYRADSHSGKGLAEALDGYPRDELFQISSDELFDQAMAILGLQDRERLRLLVRRDDFGRFVSCLVFLPRNRLTPALEQRIQAVLLKAFDGLHLEYSTRVGESVLARLHLVIYTEASAEVTADVDVAELESLLADAMRTWSDDMREVLIDEFGEEKGLALHRSYGDAFPNSYMEDFSARAALSDLKRILSLPAEKGFTVNLYRPIEATGDGFRLKLYQEHHRMTLSSVLPLLENMGLQVGEERPYEIESREGKTAWIYDFGLRSTQPADLDATEIRDRFQEAFLQIWRQNVDNDGFNKLVLGACLPIRDVVVLRAYARYLRQAGTTFSLEHIAATLANNPKLARNLVDMFRVRFDPDAELSMEDRALVAKEIAADFEQGLDAVANLNEDQVLRRMLGVVHATLRTNFFQVDSAGAPKPWLSIKLNPAIVPDCPLPRPMFETFVYSPRVEGVHLRAAKVARGGLRWSDRLEDYRTEILGLMKAQSVKNAVIVPGGAKGGFVLKSPPAGGFELLRAEAIACYQTFIRALLDVADNRVGSEVVPPPRVVRHDSDDPYLVVAADKGTATFSDIANAISLEYGFWLGDAFASGGSSGYDHKAMGITAKGAFVSVKRHFRDMGIDVSRDPITVVGIGDMSGDVFGNGMLLSESLKLVAAFDHRHIFIDPSPDPASSFAERSRLFALPRSSWADYNPALISPGGGVWSRSSKTVPVSAEARRTLGLGEDGPAALQPDQLIKLILKAPVDLLWNGGIGTYVKASDETNADAGDKANDALRVNGADLACKVVGEGGNLGFTQRGRIEFALAGGRINTDAIDNSAGVDTSDHEVNIKILLGRAIAEGELTLRQRDELLAEMTDDVAAHVLEDNDGQTRALYNSASQALSMLDVHTRTLAVLERAGLNRALEFLPTDEELRSRGATGRGLTIPELSVLLAYAKAAICAELVASDLPEDPYFARSLELYFPPAVRSRLLAELRQHPLRREIICTVVTNTMVNRGGTTFVFRLADETGCQIPDIARAHFAAWDMFWMNDLWNEIESLDHVVPAATQVELVLEARKLVERGARWLLGHRRLPVDVTATVSSFAPGLKWLSGNLGDVIGPSDAAAQAAAVERYEAAGTPPGLARRIAGLSDMFSGLDLADVARASSCSMQEAAAVYFALGEPLWLDWMRDRILALPRDDRWQALARAAVREDLYSARSALTAEVLRLGSPQSGEEVVARPGEEANAETEATTMVRSWLTRLGSTSDRSLLALDEIAASGRSDLAAISVGLQEIRRLLQASRPAS